jgi:hypothetical protein
MRSGIRVAWPLAVSGFLPPQCDAPPWPPSGNGGAAGSGGINAGTGGSTDEAGGTTGGGGTASGGGDTGGAGGTGGDGAPGGASDGLNEPVLGCSAGVWPATATLESLPWGPYFYPETVTDVSANGEVVVGYISDVVDRETYEEIHRPALFDGSSWQPVVPEALSTTAVVNCDGTVIAGGYDRLHGFIKRTGQAPVILVGKGQWATEPRGISADGTRIVGNLEYRGETWAGFGMDPVVWTDLGVARYLWPAEPRMALHISFDGGLIAGLTDHCNYPRPASDCGLPEDLFTSTGRPNETVYPGAPAAVMSSDGSTFADDIDVPLPDGSEDLSYVRLFRPSGGLSVLPCPLGACSVIDISSRGNILLVGSSAQRGGFLWTGRHGFRPLRDILAEDGVSVPYQRFSLRAMSDDGRVILGHGNRTGAVGPHGFQAFRITLPRKVYE